MSVPSPNIRHGQLVRHINNICGSGPKSRVARLRILLFIVEHATVQLRASQFAVHLPLEPVSYAESLASPVYVVSGWRHHSSVTKTA